MHSSRATVIASGLEVTWGVIVELGVLVWSLPWMESGNAAINSFDDEVEPELIALWCSPVCVSGTAKLGIDIAPPWANQCLAFFVVSQVVAPMCQRVKMAVKESSKVSVGGGSCKDGTSAVGCAKRMVLPASAVS